MSTNHTPNYQLSQWEKTDKVLMEDFNADNAKLDAALGELKSRVDGKAEASALTAAMQARNCQAVTTGYTGTGTAGPDALTSITFAKRPLFIHVAGDNDHAGFSASYGQAAAICYSQGGHSFLQLTWSGNRVSWYETYSKATQQMNRKDQWYTVFALLGV